MREAFLTINSISYRYLFVDFELRNLSYKQCEDVVNNIIIVGAGGFAKEIFGYIQGEINNGLLTHYQVKGFLDISAEAFEEMNVDSEYFGSEDDYCIQENDVFLVAIGNIELKEIIINKLLAKNAKLMTYTHSSAIVDQDSKIGKGVIICPFCIINSQAHIDDYCMLNIYSSVAHDSMLGKYSILSPYATLNGNVSTGEKLFMGTRGSILPGLKIGMSCVVAAGTVVAKDMEDRVTAFPKGRTSYLRK